MADELQNLKDFRKLGFRKIMGWPKSDLAWVEIKTLDQAYFCHVVTDTRVHDQFGAELRDNEGRPAPHRWFALLNIVEHEHVVEGLAIVAVPGPGARLRHAEMHVAPDYVVGHANTDPYDSYRDEIDGLSRSIRIAIPANVAGVPIESKASRLLELLQAYGKARFGDLWRPEADDGPQSVRIGMAGRSGLFDEDLGWLILEMRDYATEKFGEDRWQPEQAEDFLGRTDAEELSAMIAEVIRIENLPNEKLDGPGI